MLYRYVSLSAILLIVYVLFYIIILQFTAPANPEIYMYTSNYTGPVQQCQWTVLVSVYIKESIFNCSIDFKPKLLSELYCVPIIILYQPNVSYIDGTMIDVQLCIQLVCDCTCESIKLTTCTATGNSAVLSPAIHSIMIHIKNTGKYVHRLINLFRPH